MIKHIRIQNFRSLADVSVDLDPLTVLIGRSGTGKSNFVRAVRLLRDVLRSSPGELRRLIGPGIQGVRPIGYPGSTLNFDVRFDVPGAKTEFTYRLGLKLGDDFGNRTTAEEYFAAGDEVIFHQRDEVWVVVPPVLPAPILGRVVLSSLSGVREATIAQVALTSGIGCYDFPGDVLQQDTASNGTGFADNGSNALVTAAQILNNLERLGDWVSLTKSLSALNRSVRGINLHVPERNRLDVALGRNGTSFLLNAAEESEGFRRYLAHLLALYQTPPKQTMLFEHPESGIHPSALEALVEEFQSHVRKGRGQVVLTTHSPQFLNHFPAEAVRVVDIENHETRIGPLAPEQAEAVREHFLLPGELLTVDPARLPGQLVEVPG